jgi:hypothetical protein
VYLTVGTLFKWRLIMALAFKKNWKALTGAADDLADEDTDLIVRPEVEAPTIPTQLATYTVTTAPAAADWAGAMIYVTDGLAGAPGAAFSNGTSWLNVTTGLAIAV